MTQMQMTQGAARLPGIGLPVSGTQAPARGSKSFFALMTGGAAAEEPRAQTDLAKDAALSLAAAGALFVPGLFPQTPVLGAEPEAAASAVLAVTDVSVRSDLAEGILWTFPEPGGIGIESTPEAVLTAPQLVPENSVPEGREAAGAKTSGLPEFRLVQADKAIPGQTEAPAIEEAVPPPVDERQPAEMNLPQVPRRAQPSEADPAKPAGMQSAQPAGEGIEQPAEHALKTEGDASTSAEREQADKERALSPPLSLSRFLMERSAAVSAPAEEPQVRADVPAMQLAEEVKVFAEKGSGQYVVELTPQELGRVTIRLEIADGAVTLSFKAENPATQSLLAAGTGELKAALENALARPVNLTPQPAEDGGFRGQETFEERQNPQNRENPQRRHRPREAFSGVIGRIRAG